MEQTPAYLTAPQFSEALAQMRAGPPVTAAELLEVADAAHEAAAHADADAAFCREVEADARGMALAERARDYGILPERAA